MLQVDGRLHGTPTSLITDYGRATIETVWWVIDTSRISLKFHVDFQ